MEDIGIVISRCHGVITKASGVDVRVVELFSSLVKKENELTAMKIGISTLEIDLSILEAEKSG